VGIGDPEVKPELLPKQAVTAPAPTALSTTLMEWLDSREI